MNRSVSKSPSLALTATPEPSVYGAKVTLKATLTPFGSKAPIPSGSIEFFNGPSLIASAKLSKGTATLNTTALPAGEQALRAVYAGDSYFGAAEALLAHTVAKATTQTTLTSTLNPAPFGSSATLKVTVKALAPGTGTPSGSLSFLEGETLLKTASLSGGSATLALKTLAPGDHQIRAVYSGSSNYSENESALFTQTIVKASTQTTLTSTLNPAPFGSSATLKATVKAIGPGAGTPTGTISFLEGATILKTVPLSGSSASFSLKSLPPGEHEIVAQFSGDANYEPSSSAALVETIVKASTQLTLTSSKNPAPAGSSATLKAVVKALAPGSGTPTGNITFSEGSTVLKTVPLSGTTAQFPLKSLSPGAHEIVATYSGDGNYELSQSAALSQSITP